MPAPRPRGGSRACAACGSHVEAGQRYCVECGERVGSRSPELLALLRRVAGRSDGKSAGSAPATTPRPAAAARRSPTPCSALAALDARLSRLSVPSPRISAVLVLGFLGFGIVIGTAAGSRTAETLAASSRPPLKLVLPATSPAKAAEASTGTGAPPAAEAEATPETPAPEASTPAATAPSAKAPAKAGEGGSGGGKSGAGAGKAGGGEGGSTPSAGGAKLPPIKHVFLIVLSDEPYAAAFGPESTAPYLAHTLEQRGELLVRYYAVAHEQLANGIALLSGQGPTRATATNCPTYTAVTPASAGAEGQFLGEGCVYPQTTPTLPGQLEVKRLTWRAYVQGLDEPGAAAPACAHPALGQPDPSSAVTASSPYATFRNPIVYFQGLTESPSCASDDVGVGALGADLANAARTPSLSYIVPDRCHDGSPGPCPGGAPGGLPAADTFLEGIVPKILASNAYEENGLLVITTDEAPSSGEFADSSSCCGQPRFPNLPAPTGLAASLPEGGGQVGALLLSPFVKPHAVSQEPFNHFSLLRTIEDLFALKHLGYAGGAKVASLEPSLFVEKPAKR